MIHKEKDH
jgi:hypothetical protein